MKSVSLGQVVLVFRGDSRVVAGLVTQIESEQDQRISATVFPPGGEPKPFTGVQHRSLRKAASPVAFESSGNPALDAARTRAAEMGFRPWDGLEHPMAYETAVNEAHRVYLQNTRPQLYWDWPDSNQGQ